MLEFKSQLFWSEFGVFSLDSFFFLFSNFALETPIFFNLKTVHSLSKWGRDSGFEPLDLWRETH